ncbi:MAG: hypothetical protein AAGI34_15360 [Pseudomonadota bacterium]
MLQLSTISMSPLYAMHSQQRIATAPLTEANKQALAAATAGYTAGYTGEDGPGERTRRLARAGEAKPGASRDQGLTVAATLTADAVASSQDSARSPRRDTPALPPERVAEDYARLDGAVLGAPPQISVLV